LKNQEITYEVEVIDEKNRKKQLYIPAERPITLYLNNKELLTVMTLGMNTKSLIIGYLRNQQLVSSLDDIESIQIDWDVSAAAIKLKGSASNFERLTEKVTITSGCGQGTMFGNLTEDIGKFKLDSSLKIKQSVLLTIIDEVRRFSSIYKQAGSVHGCALFKGPKMLFYCEDVGRHNAVDAVAGKMWENQLDGRDLVFYTTGRLTSEMVIKGAQMHIPVLLSRSGVTQMGVEMARNVDMTLLGRCSGKHFYIFNGSQRLIFDCIV
jgi:FdhD protein